LGTRNVKTYTVPEVANLLGDKLVGFKEKKNLYNMIDAGRFPFTVYQVGERKFLVDKRQVDNFLETGKLPDIYNKGRSKKWHSGEYVNWNFRIPKDLAFSFNALCEYLNSKVVTPLSLNDYRRLAIKEFIDRRPEYKEYMEKHPEIIERALARDNKRTVRRRGEIENGGGQDM